jgi:hypothetical protein
MARRSTKYKYDAQSFRKFIDAAKKDLGITCKVTIRFKEKLHYFGYQSWDKNGNYLIVVNPAHSKEIIARNILHELRHVFQYRAGLLQDISPDVSLWQNVLYSRFNFLERYDEYLALPWEKDAREYAERHIDFLYLVEER